MKGRSAATFFGLFGAACLVWGGIGSLFSGHFIMAIIFFCVGAWCLYIAGAYRCPRCEVDILENGRGFHGPGSPAHCVLCGRRRDNVKMFQYKKFPEPWDGVYRDEGGGSQSDNYQIEHLRAQYFERQSKR
ncbi:MAG: hypothetical protein QM667_03995 [Asticcacaulis sp.]